MRWQLSEHRIPTREEVQRLAQTIRLRADAARANRLRQPVVDWAVVDCLVSSGLRSHELVALILSDLLIGHGESALIVRHGKGDKPRIVAISDRLKQHLKAFIAWKQNHGEPTEPAAPLFLSERKHPFCTRAIRYLFKRCLGAADLDERFGVHSLRHFHLSALYDETNDLRLVQDQAGHSSVATTQVYTHVCLTKRQAAVNRIL